MLSSKIFKELYSEELAKYDNTVKKWSNFLVDLLKVSVWKKKWPEADLLKWMVSCLKYLSTTKTCHLFYSTRMISR